MEPIWSLSRLCKRRVEWQLHYTVQVAAFSKGLLQVSSAASASLPPAQLSDTSLFVVRRFRAETSESHNRWTCASVSEVYSHQNEAKLIILATQVDVNTNSSSLWLLSCDPVSHLATSTEDRWGSSNSCLLSESYSIRTDTNANLPDDTEDCSESSVDISSYVRRPGFNEAFGDCFIANNGTSCIAKVNSYVTIVSGLKELSSNGTPGDANSFFWRLSQSSRILDGCICAIGDNERTRDRL